MLSEDENKVYRWAAVAKRDGNQYAVVRVSQHLGPNESFTLTSQDVELLPKNWTNVCIAEWTRGRNV